MNVNIAYWRLSGFDGNDQFIGGIETYLLQLAECCRDNGFQAHLYQCATKPFERTIGDLLITGIVTPSVNITPENSHILAKHILRESQHNGDIAVFGSDYWCLPTDYHKAVLINHGIAFDLPIEYLTRKSILKHRRLEIIKRISHFKHALERFERCRNRVCVDYNQLNWYRTWRSVDETSRIWVIPNSAPRLTELELKSRHRGQGQAIRILFARRFEPFRGTRLMASIVATLLLRFPEVQFTFAGDGSDAEWLHSRFKNNPRVTIKKVPYSERIALHLEHDIAVVPSFGSEGTSLSVVEAMASGCAVVATNVGGVPSIVIDGYNGLLVDTRESDVEAALIRLITNETYRNAIRERAGEMANDAFSLDIWKQRWVGVLNTLAASPA